MPQEALAAHSLAEAYLYLMATPCGECGKGPLEGGDARSEEEDQSTVLLTLRVTCGACGKCKDMTFRIPAETARAGDDAPTTINPGERPSRIIDVAQWITLFRAITEAANRETDRQEARRLGIEAAQCLEEAIKFYRDADNDLPPGEAFFHERSREGFRDHPEQFSRRRLIDLRGKLPSLATMRRRTEEAEQRKRRRWWRFGR
jgi:hypothetical protein